MALTAQSGKSGFSPTHRYPVIIGNVRIPLFFKFSQNPNTFKISMKKEFQQTKTIGGYVFEHWGKQPTTLSCSALIKKSDSLSTFLGLNTDSSMFGLSDPIYTPELQLLQTLFNIDQRRMKKLLESDTVSSIFSDSAIATAAVGAIAKNPLTATAACASGVEFIIRKFAGEDDLKFKEPSPASIEGYLDTLTDTIILYRGVIYSGFFTSMDIEENAKESPYAYKVNFSFLVTNTTNDWIDTMLTQTSVGRAIAGIFGASASVVTIGSTFDDLFTDSGSNTNGHV